MKIYKNENSFFHDFLTVHIQGFDIIFSDKIPHKTLFLMKCIFLSIKCSRKHDKNIGSFIKKYLKPFMD